MKALRFSFGLNYGISSGGICRRVVTLEDSHVRQRVPTGPGVLSIKWPWVTCFDGNKIECLLSQPGLTFFF